MAEINKDLQVHITWDTEPTEKAKDFIRAEFYKALQEAFQEPGWFRELMQAEIQAELKHSGLSQYMHQVPRAAQEE